MPFCRRFKIELVVRDKSSGVALGATEALDILQKDEVLGKLANQNIKVQHAAQGMSTCMLLFICFYSLSNVYLITLSL